MTPVYWILLACALAVVAAGAVWLYKARVSRGGSEMPIDIDKDGKTLGEELKAVGEKVGKRFNKGERAELRRMLFTFLVKVVGMLVAQKIDWKTLGEDAIAFGQKVVEHADVD